MERLLLSLAICAAATACTEPNPAYVDDSLPAGECRRGIEVGETFTEFERPEKLDVLIVVDASGDVEPLQKVLGAAMGEFLTTLELLSIDTRVAVATSDASGTAELARPGREVDGCGSNDVVVAKSSESNWISATRCNIAQGTRSGNGFDQPLRVVTRLLEAGAGTEFFRDDARLLVVVASKDDDCSSTTELSGIPREVCPDNPSLTDVDAAVRSWTAGRVAPDSVGLAVLAGPPSEEERDEVRAVCSATVGQVYPANRMYRATELLGSNGFFFSACTDDMAPPLVATVRRFVSSGTTTFCARTKLTQEPLAVVATDGDAQEDVAIGSKGFVYLGPTASCETGAIQFAAEALRGVDEVAVEYCSEPSE